MAGVKGRSGRKPLSIAHHLLAGTWRADRHGARRPAATAPASLPDVPPRELVADLGPCGLQFVLELWEQYAEWTPATRVLLREAAQVIDQLEVYGARVRAEGVLLEGARGSRSPHPLLRVQHQARSTLVQLLGALHLKDA